MLTVISTIIWICIWVWLKWMLDDKWWDDNYDF
jgi:membrane protein DedA with SNARE-associated domain